MEVMDDNDDDVGVSRWAYSVMVSSDSWVMGLDGEGDIWWSTVVRSGGGGGNLRERKGSVVGQRERERVRGSERERERERGRDGKVRDKGREILALYMPTQLF